MQGFYYLLRNSPKKTCKHFALKNLKYKKQSILTFWTDLLEKQKESTTRKNINLKCMMRLYIWNTKYPVSIPYFENATTLFILLL